MTQIPNILGAAMALVPIPLLEVEALGDAAATKAQLGGVLASAAAMGAESATFYRYGPGRSLLAVSFKLHGFDARVTVAELDPETAKVLDGYADDLPVDLEGLAPAGKALELNVDEGQASSDEGTGVELEAFDESRAIEDVVAVLASMIAPAFATFLGFVEGKVYAAGITSAEEPATALVTFYECATALPVPEGSVPTWLEIGGEALPEELLPEVHGRGLGDALTTTRAESTPADLENAEREEAPSVDSQESGGMKSGDLSPSA